MKTLGIVGGIGPESTVDYYRLLIQMWREQTKDGSAPSIVLRVPTQRSPEGFVKLLPAPGDWTPLVMEQH